MFDVILRLQNYLFAEIFFANEHLSLLPKNIEILVVRRKKLVGQSFSHLCKNSSFLLKEVLPNMVCHLQLDICYFTPLAYGTSAKSSNYDIWGCAILTETHHSKVQISTLFTSFGDSMMIKVCLSTILIFHKKN